MSPAGAASGQPADASRVEAGKDSASDASSPSHLISPTPVLLAVGFLLTSISGVGLYRRRANGPLALRDS
jgi:hypothetical protein